MPLFECSRIEKREILVKGLVRAKDEAEAYNQFEKELEDDNFAVEEFLSMYDISDEQCEFIEED